MSYLMVSYKTSGSDFRTPEPGQEVDRFSILMARETK